MNKALLLQKLKRQAPTILTVVGAVGVVATSVLTAKSTVKAIEVLKDAEKEKGEELTEMEVIKAALPSYIAPVIVGAATISCLFGANILNKKAQASLMSAYALLDSSYKEYKNKVESVYGKEANHLIQTEIAKDKYEEDMFSGDDDKELFFDMFSGRYIESTMEDVLKAQYELNRTTSVYGGMNANDYYAMLGLPRIKEYDELGWSAAQVYDMCWHPWIEFTNSKSELEDGLECTFIEMSPEPFPDYLEY